MEEKKDERKGAALTIESDSSNLKYVCSGIVYLTGSLPYLV
jgi:hypothetical protein